MIGSLCRLHNKHTFLGWHHCLFQSHRLLINPLINMSFLLYPHNEQCQCLLGHFSSGTLGLFGLKGQQFNFNWGGGVASPWSPTQPTSFLQWVFSPSPLRLAALPACDWPFTSRWPVTCRHPLWLPLMWCLLLCTVGVNHTPWESNEEFHTMGPLACVVWGLREGLEIKGQPEWGKQQRTIFYLLHV